MIMSRFEVLWLGQSHEIAENYSIFFSLFEFFIVELLFVLFSCLMVYCCFCFVFVPPPVGTFRSYCIVFARVMDVERRRGVNDRKID